MINVYEIEVASRFYDVLIQRAMAKIDLDSLDIQYPDGVDKSAIIYNVKSVFNFLCCAILQKLDKNELADFYMKLDSSLFLDKGIALPIEEMNKIIVSLIKLCRSDMNPWCKILLFVVKYPGDNGMEAIIDYLAKKYNITEWKA